MRGSPASLSSEVDALFAVRRDACFKCARTEARLRHDRARPLHASAPCRRLWDCPFKEDPPMRDMRPASCAHRRRDSGMPTTSCEHCSGLGLRGCPYEDVIGIAPAGRDVDDLGPSRLNVDDAFDGLAGRISSHSNRMQWLRDENASLQEENARLKALLAGTSEGRAVALVEAMSR